MSPSRHTRAARASLVALMLAFTLVGCMPMPTTVTEPTTSASTPTDSPDVPSGPMSENDVPELTTISTDDLLPGQCISGFPIELAYGQTLTAVPCADNHNAELMIVTDSEADEYPGDVEIQAEADNWCEDMLPAIANGVPESSVYDALPPDQESWEEGDRQMLCFTVAINAYYTGSFIGGNAAVHTT